tara:strand:+ start:298 stop:435 length:138 start_codon:yes stop_codon:yes gene_type:complete
MSTLNPYKPPAVKPKIETTLSRSLALQRKEAEAAKKKEASKSKSK